ncbi:MAG: glycoside hydrolase family 3 C-terminal domain-containing protein [Verrucomicrobia bacterium]|nr:glycoside hydrolase family 3 C-terminal domain-containing protein [Verrucomicrobiota bacterium]
MAVIFPSLFRPAACAAVTVLLTPLMADTPLPYRDSNQTIETRVADLLPRMTLDEKLGQLSQSVICEPRHREEPNPSLVRSGRLGAFILAIDPAVSVEIHNQFQHIAVEESRLGIPLLFGYDAIHGFRTTFPIPLGLASTWDPALVERAQAVSARETRAAGVDWTFAPMSDLARDARWGRVAETFGEDPFLTSQLAAASVRGFQGTDPGAPGHVAATLKHYLGYSAAVGGRDYNLTEITPFALRNLHLPSFHAGVQAGALTVMSSFNANDGIPAVSDRHQLTDILRGDLGFKGFVVSDWEGVIESIAWGYSATPAEAARRSLAAGNDMEMVSTSYRDTLAAEIAAGRIPPAVIDEAVRRVLRVKFALGLFEHPYTPALAADKVFLQPDAVALARETVARSAVLLQNPDVLPLAKTVKHLALIGPLGDDGDEMLGTWPGMGRPQDVVTLAQGLRAKLAPGATLEVVRGCDLLEAGPRTRTLMDGSVVIDPVAEARETPGIAAAVAAANRADVVILALGEPRGWSGENASRAELSLTGRQSELLAAVTATGRPLVIVTFSGRPLVIPTLPVNAAWLHAWHPGVQAGTGLADVLFGDAVPSGRLAITFPRAVGQLPLFYNGYTTGRPDKRDYRDLPSEPLYPFGYGLSYTTFRYGAVEIVPPAQPGQPATARTTVINTGRRPADEVVQLYLRDVACSEGARPEQELRGWQRVHLAPGETRTVSFALDDAALGFFNREGRWLTEPGDFLVWIAPHAHIGEGARYTLTR